MPALNLGRVPAYYHKYISKVPTENLREGFTSTEDLSFLKSIPVSKWDYSYAPGKWTVKELVQHIIDAERIFSYRALRFARKDSTPLAGFEENDYAANSDAAHRTVESLIAEFEAVRASSVALFNSFTDEQLEREGTANGQSIYVRAIGFIILGHSIHHAEVLKEKYLPNAPLI
jgi:uncharacterized damage-inducible protein DinB